MERACKLYLGAMHIVLWYNMSLPVAGFFDGINKIFLFSTDLVIQLGKIAVSLYL